LPIVDLIAARERLKIGNRQSAIGNLKTFQSQENLLAMQVEASRGPIEELDVQALAVAVFKNEKADSGFLKKIDELSGGLVRSALDAEEFSGKEGETAYFHLLGNDKLKARRLLLIGVGEGGDYKSATVSQMAGTAVRSLRSKNGFPVMRVKLQPRPLKARTSHCSIQTSIALLKKKKRRSIAWSSWLKTPIKMRCNRA
jgi:hypothetical protein